MKKQKDEFSIVPTAQDGKNLIREALQRQNERNNEKVLATVQAILERLNLCRSIKVKTDRRIEFLEHQLDAINKAKFQIKTKQYSSEVSIVFNDDDLNIDWNLTEQW